MEQALAGWQDAAMTSVSFFWMAFWAFALGYTISSAIQVFVTEARIQQAMGTSGPKAVGLGTFFGFISSSCSFAALSSTRSLFAKGAGLVPSLAFLLASTNLVVELGIVIAVFLSWQFVVGEYVGGLLLIAVMWIVVRLTKPTELIASVREELSAGHDDEEIPDWRELATSREGWARVARRYGMEWQMVYKDVTIGFTVAGIIKAFVPRSFFETLFIGTAASTGPADYTFLQIVEHALVGPVAAFFTFIGSMGNIPLAAVLYGNGVSFAGILGFIFSDLVVLPVLRINAQYYGWRMALYIAGVFLVAIVASAVGLYYGFALFDALPERASGLTTAEQDAFGVDYTLFFNVGFALVSAAFVWLARTGPDTHAGGHDHGDDDGHDPVEIGLSVLTGLSVLWLAGGLLLGAVS